MPSSNPNPDANAEPRPTSEVVEQLWLAARLPAQALAHLQLSGGEAAVLPSSFCVATAAQASLALAGLAAVELGTLRSPLAGRQLLWVDRAHAAVECSAHFALDGREPPLWDPLSGLYACGAEVAGAPPGWVRIHANFAHHRDGALRLLGLPADPHTPRDAVAAALRRWTATDFEQAAADAGLVVAAARRHADWLQHPHAQAVASLPVVDIQRIGDAPPRQWPPAPSERSPGTDAETPPLSGLRVLDLTRILAGPVAGRCLAAYGADVMLVNGPHLPNISAIADTSRGKLSTQIDLRQADGRRQLDHLLDGAQVFLQGYRPGALAQRGYGAAELTRRWPGLVIAELSAYGWEGPWADRRGFDSLVQTATGFNLDEAEAAGLQTPKAMPMQILDYAAGHLLAFGIQAALWRQQREGGSWQVRVSLAGVGRWLRSLGRLDQGLAAQAPDITPFLGEWDSGFGRLRAVRHAPQFSRSVLTRQRPAMPPGSHPPLWPASDCAG